MSLLKDGIYLNGEKLERYIQRNNEIVAENAQMKTLLVLADKTAQMQDEQIERLKDEVNKLQKALLISQNSERLAWATAEQYKRNPSALYIKC